ncbi:MAG: M20/M25/M40 family metallo-hydrolase, partial [Nakamurella sp.]
VEAGCQGTMAFTVTTHGSRAHSARSWLGHNAIHDVAEVLQRIGEFDVRSVEIDGCSYREGLNAVDVRGGVAGNVVPDVCVVKINFRFAPDRSAADAVAAITEHFAGFDLEVNDAAGGALPGLSQPAAAAFVAAAGGTVAGKLGWTDVARFAALGIPAVNFGPGDPMLAHTRDEHVSRAQIGQLTEILRAYLS